MDREKRVQAMMSTKVVLSKMEYVTYLLEKIIDENATLQNALENDKFHIVGASAARIEDYSRDLRIALDA